MGAYKETYRELCHGTDEESARSIKSNGFEVRGNEDSWCGPGIYFYDIKKKAWWSADRTCKEIKKKSGKKLKPAVIFADIIDIDDNLIFDLRVYKDLCDFEKGVKPLLKDHSYKIPGLDDVERIIKLRSMLISYYAKKNGKKLVIGNFRQRPQPKYEHAIKFSNDLDLIFGIETIYCVKDNGILENIREGGRTDGKD